MNTTLHFVIADNQDITKAGLRLYIQSLFDGASIAEATGKVELVETLMAYEEAVVVILDPALFHLKNGEELLGIERRFPDVSWILFSNELEESLIRKLSMYRNFSMVLKENSGEEIGSVLKCAAQGERFLCHQITNLLLAGSNKPELHPVLTPTEIDILKLIAHGKSVKEIATLRTSSVHTIITHKKNIFRKLEINNIYEATKYALRAGLVEMIEYYI